MIPKIAVDITSPIKMNMDLTMQSINILVGMNGTGKSFLMKLFWACGMIASTLPLKDTNDLVEPSQFVFDNTYSNHNLNGNLTAFFEKGTLALGFKNGKVISAVAKNIGPEPVPTYMSSRMRSFNAMAEYLRVRKGFSTLSADELMHNMLKTYKLYDVMYVERLIKRFPIELSSETQDVLKNFGITEQISKVNVDLDKCDFYTTYKNDPKQTHSLCTWYGSGHQALLNMFLGGLANNI